MGRKVAWFDPVTAEAQRDRASEATFERLERDLRHANWRIRPHLEAIRERLFDPGFTAEDLLRSCPGDRASVTVFFHAQLADSIWDYISKARLETGSRLLRDTSLRVSDISNLLGYSDRMVFSDAFRRWTGLRPQEFRNLCRASAPRVSEVNEELLSLDLLEKLRRNQLDTPRVTRLLATLEALTAPSGASAPAVKAVDHRSEQLTSRSLAAWIWEMLETVPEQKRRLWVRDLICIDSPEFLYLLGEKIRRRVRKDPHSCLELAELALEHLEANKKTLGEKVSNLRALALAWLGNAQRLVWDYARAHQTFTRARQEWKSAGEDPQVEAELCDLEASLRMYQRRTGEALELLARSSSLAQTLGHARILVSSLLQRVAILGPRGDHHSAIADLRLALRELEKLDDPALTLVALCDLTTAYVDGEKPRQALEVLPKAYELCEALDETVTRHQLGWTEGLARQALGDLDAAEELLQEARAGFLDVDGQGYAAVVALDLGILRFEREQHYEASLLAATAIPVFESLGLSRETVAAVELLRRSIIKNAVSLPILKETRAHLVQGLRDPTTHPPGTSD